VLTSRALDDALRLGEDRASCAERIDILPSLVARLVRIDTRHAAGRVRECLGQALNRAKVYLESHRDDECIIFKRTARLRADGIARRVEGRDTLGNVRDVRRDEGTRAADGVSTFASSRNRRESCWQTQPEMAQIAVTRERKEPDRTYHPGCTTGRWVCAASSSEYHWIGMDSHTW
jgi:hypothetical protein